MPIIGKHHVHPYSNAVLSIAIIGETSRWDADHALPLPRTGNRLVDQHLPHACFRRTSPQRFWFRGSWRKPGQRFAVCGGNPSRFLRALFQFSKRAAGEATEFSRSRVELLSVIGAARLECGKPAAEAGELIRRQLGNSFSDFFDLHVAQYSTAEAWLRDRPPFRFARLLPERICLLRCSGYATHDSR